MALPWSNITPEETDVNSALSQSLMDKLRTNQDNIRARVRDTPTDANWLRRAHIKVATGSVLAGASVDVTMNDYAFFPAIRGTVLYNPGAGGYRVVTQSPIAVTYGTFRLHAENPPENCAVYWRYITASDNPLCYVVYDGSGNIMGVWESEDPVDNPLSMEGYEGMAVELPSVPRIKQLADSVLSISQDKAMDILKLHAERLSLEYNLDPNKTPQNLDDISSASDVGLRWQQVLKLHFLRELAVDSKHKFIGDLIFNEFKIRDDKLVLKGE